MPYAVKASLAATASLATMAITKYGSPPPNGPGANFASGPGGPRSKSNGSSAGAGGRAKLHDETVKQMYMWKP